MSQKLKDNRLLRYLILALVLLNVPGFTIVYINGSLASILSYTSYALILGYVILCNKSGNCKEMLLMGGLYFLTSGLVTQEYMPDTHYFLVIIIKYFVIIWGGYEVLKRTSKEELWIFMLIGTFSILGNIFLFQNPVADYGRYSGFYLDPNNAGLICLMGFALSFSIKPQWRLFGKLIFTALGLLTFSRTFMITWLFMNLLSIKLDVRNAKMLLVGFATVVLLVTFNEFLPVQNPRLQQLSDFINGESTNQVNGVDEDSREETWARYYDALLENPFFGNGYRSFLGNGVANTKWGVHNTYLLIWGEGGILPLLVFLIFMGKLFLWSWHEFKKKPYTFLMLINLALFLMTNHGFMITDYSLFLLVWIAIQLYSENNETSIEIGELNMQNNLRS